MPMWLVKAVKKLGLLWDSEAVKASSWLRTDRHFTSESEYLTMGIVFAFFVNLRVRIPVPQADINSIRTLVPIPRSKLHLDTHVSLIGLTCYYHLEHGKSLVRKHIRRIASSVCPTPRLCPTNFSQQWLDDVRTLLLHPDEPTPLADLVATIQNTLIEGVCGVCKFDAARKLQRENVLTTGEEEALAEGVQNILRDLGIGSSGDEVAEMSDTMEQDVGGDI
ncbi:hypothetical protein BDV98DRAFT_583566 [Pterulicium gracile]|uniref:Uncharacterized protein n=1 Tax=Pterulicium gracile TaxID=1884261 RepID=A0A5C3QPR1_9AGAR|nr:hypothetical protein BDV98DRAFT_583566 [Pterula gracilis]